MSATKSAGYVGVNAFWYSTDVGSAYCWYLTRMLFESGVDCRLPGAWYTFQDTPSDWSRSGIVVHEYCAPFVATVDGGTAATFGAFVTTGPPATPSGSSVAAIP